MRAGNKGRRHRVGNKRRDRRVFTASAMGVHPENIAQRPMRGGYRL